MAETFLEYLSWEKSNEKTNFEKYFKKDLEIFKDWLKIYCEEYNCSEENV